MQSTIDLVQSRQMRCRNDEIEDAVTGIVIESPVAGRGFEYDLVLFVANWPSARAHAWRTLLRARAIENLGYCVGVNRVGVDGNQLPYSGDSAALDYLGQAMADLGAQEQVVTVALDQAALGAFREKFPAWMDADAFELK